VFLFLNQRIKPSVRRNCQHERDVDVLCDVRFAALDAEAEIQI
jgi:hypothetical protein